MSCGKDFVETLKKIGYPKAHELNEGDFDWLFDSLEDKSFLEWFCGNINEQHVLSEKELQEFDNLLESGKPILEGNALDEVLKTLKPMDSKNGIQKNGIQEDEEELKNLEDELQALQKLKKLQIHRHNKLQVMLSENSQMLQNLKSKEEEAQNYLQEGLKMFNAANDELNKELLSFTDAASKFTSFFTASDSEQGSDLNPVFFSQLSLDKYLSQEEQSTAALTSYVKTLCCPGMSESVDNSEEGSFQLDDIGKQVTCDETNELCEESREIARLQTAYICAQHQLIQQQAKEESMKSTIKCAESMLQSLNKDIGKQENLDDKISSLNDEISAIRQDIARINNEELLPLLKEKARLLCVPVVKGLLEHQIAQKYYASIQDKVCRYLIRQKASFELIELAYEMELKKHKETSCQLENLVESLKQSSNEVEQTLQVMTEQSQCAKPRGTISSSDSFPCRLFQILEGDNKKQQLFKTYKNLEQMAQKLKQDYATAQDQLAASSQQQSLLLSKLESDVDALRNALYRGGNQLQLTSQELSEQFCQLEADLKKLNQLLVDLVADLKSKRSFLESNKLHQIERKLYVYYFQDEEKLQEVVETLEQQSEAKASGLED
ncbi:PREDICTED: HAUS augmin-like complex subunit 3 [Merops nubicus]|nr:PREDICTED: HAUS augmin-like complex subunit 3 [Merops nubicus]